LLERKEAEIRLLRIEQAVLARRVRGIGVLKARLDS
jgi:hypothetical protein